MTRLRRAPAGLLAYVRPTFMLPAVGMSVYGAVLAAATTFEPTVAVLHAGTVGLALFVAHLRDGYVDGHLREEETPRLDGPAFQLSIALGTLAVVLLSGILAITAGAIAALSTLVLLVLALLHAPYLDRHPVTVTVDYPVGIGTTVVGGYAAQAGGVDLEVVIVALLFSGLLSGIKIGIDRLDRDFDASIGKRTVPVVLGSAGADRVALTIFSLTSLLTMAVGVAGNWRLVAIEFPFAVLAALAPLACLVATRRFEDEWAVRVQMASTYVFAIGLFFAVCGNGCAGSALVDRALEAALG